MAARAALLELAGRLGGAPQLSHRHLAFHDEWCTSHQSSQCETQSSQLEHVGHPHLPCSTGPWPKSTLLCHFKPLVLQKGWHAARFCWKADLARARS